MDCLPSAHAVDRSRVRGLHLSRATETAIPAGLASRTTTSRTWPLPFRNGWVPLRAPRWVSPHRIPVEVRAARWS